MTHSATITPPPATIAPPELDELCVNTLRFLAVDAVQKAKSGHPGLPLGSAAMAYALWDRSLKFNPRDPLWPDRDRFVLSAGHGCALLYALLHVTGFDLPLEELERFRQWGSRTPGHPEYGKTPGVEATTGPLGQGLANAVGMAIAEVALAARFNRPGHPIVDHYTYVLASDGDLEEGISSEAGSEAGHLRLGKLIVLYADNHITIEGSTELAFTEDRMARFAAFGWHVQRIENSNDIDAVADALEAAREETGRPSLIAVRTHIGFGSPHKQDTVGGPRGAARSGGGPPDQRGAGLAGGASLPYSRGGPGALPGSRRAGTYRAGGMGVTSRVVCGGTPGPGRGVPAGHAPATSRGLGRQPSGIHPGGRPDGDPHRFGKDDRRPGLSSARTDGRLGRSGPQHPHEHGRGRELRAGELGGTQHALRHPRACHGRHPERHGVAPRSHPLSERPS